MAEMSDIAAAINTLKPIGQWFGVLSAMTALVLWLLEGRPMIMWPWPHTIIVFGWIGAAAFTLVIAVANGMFMFASEQWKAMTLPTAPGPGGPPAPSQAPTTQPAGQSTDWICVRLWNALRNQKQAGNTHV